jgi:hypothetical protein
MARLAPLDRSASIAAYGLEYTLIRERRGIHPGLVAPRALTGPLRGLRDRNAAAASAGYTYFLHNDPNDGHPLCHTGCEIRLVNASEGVCLECQELMGDAQ